MAESKPKKKSVKRRKNRQMLIIPNDTVKGKIISAILEVAKQKRYFTNEDIFTSLAWKMKIDMTNVKKIKNIYNYIIFVTGELEREGYLRGYYVPGSRKIHWELIRPLGESD